MFHNYSFPAKLGQKDYQPTHTDEEVHKLKQHILDFRECVSQERIRGRYRTNPLKFLSYLKANVWSSMCLCQLEAL